MKNIDVLKLVFKKFIILDEEGKSIEVPLTFSEESLHSNENEIMGDFYVGFSLVEAEDNTYVANIKSHTIEAKNQLLEQFFLYATDLPVQITIGNMNDYKIDIFMKFKE